MRSLTLSGLCSPTHHVGRVFPGRLEHHLQDYTQKSCCRSNRDSLLPFRRLFAFRLSIPTSNLIYLGSSRLQLFALTLPLRMLTTANVLQQGSAGLAVLSAIHVALNVGMMWILLGNAIVATQVVP